MFRDRFFVRVLMSLAICEWALAFRTSTAPAEQPTPHVTLEALVAIIRAREERVQSALFKWTEQRFDAKGSWNRSGLPFPNAPEGQPVPAEDITYASQRTFSFDGEKMRHFVTENTPDVSGEFFETAHLATFDGEFSRMLDHPTRKKAFHYGRIYPRERMNNELHNLIFEPLLQCYRLFRPSTGLLNSENYGIETSDALIAETPCVVVAELGSATRSLKNVFWVDPARDFLILRYALQTGDGPIQRQTDFSYVQDTEHGWVPSGWRIMKYEPDGALIMSITAAVIEYKLNLELPPTEFAIEFPVGTYVDDLRDGTNYIQRADGSQRTVTPAERSVSYERLRDSESGAAVPLPAISSRRVWLIAANLIVLVVIVAFLIWRRRHVRNLKR
jgi:hypothetical protein